MCIPIFVKVSSEAQVSLWNSPELTASRSFRNPLVRPEVSPLERYFTIVFSLLYVQSVSRRRRCTAQLLGQLNLAGFRAAEMIEEAPTRDCRGKLPELHRKACKREQEVHWRFGIPEFRGAVPRVHTATYLGENKERETRRVLPPFGGASTRDSDFLSLIVLSIA